LVFTGTLNFPTHSRSSCILFAVIILIINIIPRKWSDAEQDAVERQLEKYLQTFKLPGQRECQACISAEGAILADRTWKNVKDFVLKKIVSLQRNM